MKNTSPALQYRQTGLPGMSAKLKVPQDLAMVGFDDIREAA